MSGVAVLEAPQTEPTEPVLDIQWASEAQREAFECGPVPQCGSGGFGSAKTWAYCLKALWLSTVYPGNRGLIFRKVGKELRMTTMATFWKLCPMSAFQPFGRWSAQEGLLRLNNGSEILWMHMEDPNTANVIRGLEINWFFGDQAEEIDEAIFDLLMSRLGRWDRATVPPERVQAIERQGKRWAWCHPESGKPIPPIYPMLAVNPDTDLHWVYRRFHPESEEWQSTYRQQGYRMIFFNTLENRFLTQQNKDQMLSRGVAFVRRYVLGQWGLPEGQIHDIPAESYVEFDDPDTAQAFLEWLRRTCTLMRVLDHGDSAPTVCGWFAITQAGDIFVYREYYVPNELVSTHRREITALSQGERYTWDLADPSIFAKLHQKHGGRWSTAEEYSDRSAERGYDASTAIQWHPADNNELGTRNRINEYLHVDPYRVHPVTKTRGAPRLFFLKRSEAYPQGAAMIIRETRAQKRVQVGTDGGEPVFTDERNPDIPDHGYDVLRYCLSSRPPVAREASRAVARNSFVGRQRAAKAFARKVRR